MPDPQDPTILKNLASKVPGGEKLPEASNTKLVKCLLKKCVLQEKPVTFKVLGNGRRRKS